MAAIFRKAEWNYIALAVILLLVFPLALSDFRLNMVGKYLTFAFVAVGLVLCWGETGILSLGQGIFFGLGGYFMAMFLKLEASGTALPTSWTGTAWRHCPGSGCRSTTCSLRSS